MADLLVDSRPVARKTYDCNASEFVNEHCLEVEMTIGELRQVVKAKQANWKIQPGQRYVKQVVADQGGIYTFRAIPEMHELCLKYDMYPEQ